MSVIAGILNILGLAIQYVFECGLTVITISDIIYNIEGLYVRTKEEREETTMGVTETNNSYFDGGLLQLIGWHILGAIVTGVTLGICYPWAVCMIYNWEIKHTVINGRRLRFNGTAIQLFGNWIKWLLLCIITLGIYSFWVSIALKKWKVKHTEFAN